jgi:hypothetical protein
MIQHDYFEHLIVDYVIRMTCKPTYKSMARVWAEARAHGMPILEWRVSPGGRQLLWRELLRAVVKDPRMHDASLEFVFGVPLKVDMEITSAREVWVILRRQSRRGARGFWPS